MSLKYFHIVFVTISAVTAIGFGIWCALGDGYRLLAIPAFVFGFAVVPYGFWFLKKMTRLEQR